MKTILVTILLFSSAAFGGDFELSAIFNGIQILESDIRILQNASSESNLNVMLTKLKQGFPDLKIIVLEKSKVVPLPMTIAWNDSAVSAKDKKWYLDHSDSITSEGNVGFFLGPYEGNEKLEGRPLASDPILFVRANAPDHVIKHEVLHYLVYRSRSRVFGEPSGLGHQTAKVKIAEGLSKQLDENMISGHPFRSAQDVDIFSKYYLAFADWIPYTDAEEIDVVNLLLANSEKLNLSQEGAVFQLQYMVQNFHGVAPKLQELVNAKFELEDARSNYVQIVPNKIQALNSVIESLNAKYQAASEKVPFYAKKFNLN